VAIALGGNVGDVESIFRWAVAALSPWLLGPRLARLYRTQAVSPIPQAEYLNTAICGRTSASAEDLLALCKRLERQAGRRAGVRDAPRPLDLDLLLWGERSCDAPELTLPHPRLRRRHFVLAPLAEIAPDLVVPPDGRTVAELLESVDGDGTLEIRDWRDPALPQEAAEKPAAS